MTKVLLMLAVLVGATQRAWANPDAVSEWRAREVRFPVAADDKNPTTPWSLGDAKDAIGAVTVSSQRAVALWLSPAEIARVRAGRRDVDLIRTQRVVATGSTQLWLDEPLRHVAGGVELIEPPGPGSLWVLSATRDVEIVVETAAARMPGLRWEKFRADVFRWIDDDGGADELPQIPGDEDRSMLIRLRGAHAAARAFGQVASPLASALALWRKVDAEQAIAAARPANDPYLDRIAMNPAGATVVDDRGAAFGPAAATWSVSVQGPARVVIEGRAVRPAAGWNRERAKLDVWMGRALLGRREDIVDPVADVTGTLGAEAEALGRILRVDVVLGPGVHKLEVDGTELDVVRLEKRIRKLRLRDADVGKQLEETRARVGAASQTARAISRLLGANVEVGPQEEGGLSAELLHYVGWKTSPAVIGFEPGREAETLLSLISNPRINPALRDALVLELAPRLPVNLSLDAVARVAASWPDVAPAVLAVLAPRLQLGSPSDGATAAEHAWRRAPTSPLPRQALVDSSRLASLHRIDPLVDPRRAAPTAMRWLAPTPDDDGAGSLVELSPDERVEFVIPEPLQRSDGERLAVVRVLAMTPAAEPGPIRVWLDGQVHIAVGVSPVESIEVAAAPGQHRLRVEAPNGTRIFVSAPGLRGVRGGFFRVFYPTGTAEQAPRYALPSPTAGPIRVELRTHFPGPARPTRIEARVHTDSGPPRDVVLETSSLEPEAWPVAGGTSLSTGASAWIWLPPLSSQVWIESDHPDLLVHVGLRRGKGESAPPQVAPPHLVNPLAEVARHSGVLVGDPTNTPALLARANALMAMDEMGAARRDLAAAMATASPLLLPEVVAHVPLLVARSDQSYLPPQPQDSPIRNGVALTPVIAPTEDLGGALARARSVRGGADGASIASGTDGEVADLWVRARLAQVAGDTWQAYELWNRFPGWQAKASALAALTSDTTLDTAGGKAVELTAPTAFGLAAELDAVALPRVARARATATRTTQWTVITNTSANAGQATRTEPSTSPLDLTARAAVRRALLAAPWPDATVLLPGKETQFSIVGPAQVNVSAWCRRLWPNTREGNCSFEMQVDQEEKRKVDVRFATAATVLTQDVAAGAHRVRVRFHAADAEDVAAVRFTSSGKPRPPRKTKVFLARRARPAEIVVAGPAVIGVEAREWEKTGAREVSIHVDRGDGSEVKPPLAPRRGDRLDSNSSYRVVLVPEGTHWLRVVPDRGTVAVRFARRVAGGTSRLRSTTTVLSPMLASGIPWRPQLGIPVPEVAHPQPEWMISAEARVGQETSDTADDEAGSDIHGELAVELRTAAAGAAWVGSLQGRTTEGNAPSWRAGLVADTDVLPWNVGGRAEFESGVQAADDGTAWRVGAGLRFDRSFLLRPSWWLAPDLGLRWVYLGGAKLASADDWISSTYRRDHPLQWIARLTVRARPWVDQFLVARVETRSNANWIGIDQVRTTLSWRGLLELRPLRGPMLGLAYRPSYRFADEHRRSSFARHEFATELRWGRPTRRGRLSLGAVSQLHVASGTIGHALGVFLRWDDARNGERVRFSFEDPLADFSDGVLWRDPR